MSTKVKIILRSVSLCMILYYCLCLYEVNTADINEKMSLYKVVDKHHQNHSNTVNIIIGKSKKRVEISTNEKFNTIEVGDYIKGYYSKRLLFFYLPNDNYFEKYLIALFCVLLLTFPNWEKVQRFIRE